MKEDSLVSVEGVSKKFALTLKRSLWYGVSDLAAEVTGLRTERHELRHREFWAVRDISFSVKRGQVVGLIGPNGAGKTTLLRMINGLIKPDHGRITVRGRVGALIALGAGFNPILTGRENIYISAAILGIPQKEIGKKLDQIIDFAGIGDFLEMPVQSYSSGMKVRLGFSVAMNLRPDIMLIDEVLAVGDFAFRNKCLRAIREIRDSGVALIFVSHSLGQVQAICDEAIYLKRGEIVWRGSPLEVISRYSLDEPEKATRFIHDPGSEAIMRVVDFEVLDMQGRTIDQVLSGAPITLRMTFDAVSSLQAPWFNFLITPSQEQTDVASLSQPLDVPRPSFPEGRHTVEVKLDKLPLLQGQYQVGVSVHSGEDILQRYARVHNLGTLLVTSRDNQLWSSSTYVEIEGHWSTQHHVESPGIVAGSSPQPVD